MRQPYVDFTWITVFMPYPVSWADYFYEQNLEFMIQPLSLIAGQKIDTYAVFNRQLFWHKSVACSLIVAPLRYMG